MTQHTPGPWTYREGFIIAEQFGWKGAFVAKPLHVAIDNNVPEPARAEANARLIAAAPDMATEIRKQIDWLKHAKTRVAGPESIMLGFDQSIKYLEAVLAKAEGRA